MAGTKQVAATLQTTSGGAFTFNVTPQLNTTYQAQWKGAESSVGVQVQPTVTLPAGWKFATALDGAQREGDVVRFATTPAAMPRGSR